jgi:hypothetical protein
MNEIQKNFGKLELDSDQSQEELKGDPYNWKGISAAVRVATMI